MFVQLSRKLANFFTINLHNVEDNEITLCDVNLARIV
jgi:hypothetical protein